MRNILFIIILAALAAGCSKSEVPTGTDTPKFYLFGGLSNGDSIYYQAGIDHVYHFTSVKTDGDYWRSLNAFSKEDCPTGDCPGSLRVEFTFTTPDTTLGGFELPFASPDTGQPQKYQVLFHWADSLFYQENTLTINNQIVAFGGTGANLQVLNGVAEVSLQSIGQGGVFSEQYQLIDWANPGAYPQLRLKISHNGPDLYRLEAVTPDTVGYLFLWENGVIGSEFTTDSLKTDYRVSMFKNNQLIASAHLGNLFSQTQIPITTNGYTFDASPIGSGGLPEVTVQYVDKEGMVWRSDRGPQNLTPASVFYVSSNNPYEPNENGVPTRRLMVSFRCVLYNAGGDHIFLTDAVGAIAMALR